MMKKMILISTVLITSLSFAADVKDKKKAASPPPSASTMSKADVTGNLKWTGYGVGKSHTGELAIKSGQVEMKGEELVGGEFLIDMTSLKTADSEKLQGHLQSPDFFDVKNQPEAKFKITKVEALKAAAGSPTHKITGDLTIKGKTHPETFLTTVKKEGTKWTAQGEAEIKDRTQYDIVYNSAKFKSASALGDKLIEDKIKVEMNLTTK